MDTGWSEKEAVVFDKKLGVKRNTTLGLSVFPRKCFEKFSEEYVLVILLVNSANKTLPESVTVSSTTELKRSRIYLCQILGSS